jgi:hypothetical protein
MAFDAIRKIASWIYIRFALHPKKVKSGRHAEFI